MDMKQRIADLAAEMLHTAFPEAENLPDDLAALLEMSSSAVSHQLSSLKKARLVRTRREGKLVFYSMADDHIKNIYKMAFEHIHE